MILRRRHDEIGVDKGWRVQGLRPGIDQGSRDARGTTPENDFIGWALTPRKSGVSVTESPSSVLGLKIK